LQKHDNQSRKIWQIETMKLTSGIFILLFVALGAAAQTNNLASLLQQGLIEEQANLNLDAAIADYQSLALQFDKDRQVAATAIFRLGECYRMQGKTNEAAAQYQRILSDFPDQSTLTTLSRQDLAGMGTVVAESQPSSNSDGQLWNKVKNLPATELEKVLPTLVSDAVLTSLLQERNEAETKLAELQINFAPTHSEVLEQKAVLDEINKQISRKINGIMLALKIRAAPSNDSVAASSPPDNEDEEIAQIQQMIQNSPDLINAPDSNGSTPLENAASHGWLKVEAFLLDHGADVNARSGSALFDAVEAGNRAMVEFLLAHGADANAINNSFKQTPLAMAVQHGFEAVTEVLLANKADVNARDSQGNTPLSVSAQLGRTNIVQMLLAAGAIVNTENIEGRTPLGFAADSGSLETVKALLAAKADPNAGTMDAPLLCAVDQNNLGCAELLLQAGANPNVDGLMHCPQNTYGSRWYNEYSAILRSATPLWLAIQKHELAMVQLLLKYKANPDDSQISEPPPVIFWALSNTNILQALLDAGANPNIKDNDGRTPLSVAAENISLEEVKLLLAAKADPNRRDPDGQTPLKVFERVASGEFTFGSGNVPPPDRQRTLATLIVDLLRHHGALENLPDWDSIQVGGIGNNHPVAVFQRSTNDWNHFTLLEAILQYYEFASGSSSWNSYDQWTQYPINPGIPFPDLSRVAVLRPSPESTNVARIEVNLLNGTNGIDGTKDMPLEFGDTVEIPEREHTLAETDTNGPAWIVQISSGLRGGSGSVKLVVLGGQTTLVHLDQFGPLDCDISQVLDSSQARNVLTSDSDLSRVKVVRQDRKTGKACEWILNCAGQQQPDGRLPFRFQGFIQNVSQSSQAAGNLWLRDGDVIKVPENP
jgi:uncharacterized protein